MDNADVPMTFIADCTCTAESWPCPACLDAPAAVICEMTPDDLVISRYDDGGNEEEV